MDLLDNVSLIRKDGTAVSSSEVAQNKLIGFYFAASWCAPCRTFTSVLVDAYNQMKSNGKEFEIVYVTSDQKAEKFQSYFKDTHGDWVALPFKHEAIKLLRQRFRIKGVPVLVISKSDGTIITDEGRADIQTKGAAAWDQWCAE